MIFQLYIDKFIYFILVYTTAVYYDEIKDYIVAK